MKIVGIIPSHLNSIRFPKKILDMNNISNIVIEANNQLGGRARKAHKSFGSWFDMGCSYLHEGEINPLTSIAESLKVPINYENGDIFSKSNYKDGFLDGLFEEFHPNGKLASKGKYKKNNKVGTWFEYSKRGIEKKRTSYD